MSEYIKDPSELALQGDEVLLNADEELLMFLEEVVIYTFQQTVYHLTKVKCEFVDMMLNTGISWILYLQLVESNTPYTLT